MNLKQPIETPINFSTNSIREFRYKIKEPPPVSKILNSPPSMLKFQFHNTKGYPLSEKMKYKVTPITYKDDKLYNYIKHRTFIIENLELNKPVVFKINEVCLTENIDNTVGFDEYKDVSSQYFIVENSNTNRGTFHIKTSSNQYLGSPNINNIVYCYSSKNEFTEWNIYKLTHNKYTLEYVGEKFNKSAITIVVSRYNENIDWLIPYNDIVTVYNKGIADIPNFSAIVELPNKGREGDTYLTHIIRNYNHISDRIIFIQGSPFEHNETIIFGIDNYKKMLDIQPLGLQYLKNKQIPPQEIIDEYKITTDFGLEYMVLECDGDLISPLFVDKGATRFVENYQKEYGELYDASLSLLSNYIINSELPYDVPLNRIQFTYCGLFSVTKNVILKNTLTLYKSLSSHLIEKNLQGGVNGYILEKMWLYIFNHPPRQ